MNISEFMQIAKNQIIIASIAGATVAAVNEKKGGRFRSFVIGMLSGIYLCYPVAQVAGNYFKITASELVVSAAFICAVLAVRLFDILGIMLHERIRSHDKSQKNPDNH